FTFQVAMRIGVNGTPRRAWRAAQPTTRST
ncbi:MAG: hypothetical protein JWQ18_620, partial [Conexibacter sp.]|nr:hypothetical protein [Conexibacter sp.]